jgi:protein-S-isoprenylcysteine O-methyltransferase Ste14
MPDVTEPNVTTDRPNRLPWPPIIYVIAILVAVAIDRAIDLWPLPKTHYFIVSGTLVAIAGVVIAAAGLIQFRRTGTPFDPTAPAEALATDGIYATTRNPMYLGALGLFLGLAFALRSGGLLVVTPAVAVALQLLAIRPEEAYLERRFGDAYRAYKRRVRRWI